MPKGNGTGPMSRGPMNGRGMGYCSGLTAPGFAGFFGNGRGHRRMFNATGIPGHMRFGSPASVSGYDTNDHEKDELKKQKENLEEQLHSVKKRLSDLGEDDK